MSSVVNCSLALTQLRPEGWRSLGRPCERPRLCDRIRSLLVNSSGTSGRSIRLFSRSPTPRPARISIARVILATMLTLVLLSSVAPLSSLSTSHECQMACCAGKPSHTSGSCSVAFATDEQNESADEPQQEHATHGDVHDVSGSTSETTASSGHHTTKHHSPRKSLPTNEYSRILNVVSQTITSPCSPECPAAASAPTQLRRPRDAGAMSLTDRPRPPTLVLPKRSFSEALSLSAERRRQIRPRAPPVL